MPQLQFWPLPCKEGEIHLHRGPFTHIWGEQFPPGNGISKDNYLLSRVCLNYPVGFNRRDIILY